MIWLKSPDDFPLDCARARLSDAAYRTHSEGLHWTMGHLTEGVVDEHEVRRFANTRGDLRAAIEQLIEVGFWERCDDGYRIEHCMQWQLTREEVDTRRGNAARRQRRSRRERAGLPPKPEDAPRTRRAAPRAGVQDDRMSRRDSRVRTRVTPGLVGSGLDGAGQPATPATTKGSTPPVDVDEDARTVLGDEALDGDQRDDVQDDGVDDWAVPRHRGVRNEGGVGYCTGCDDFERLDDAGLCVRCASAARGDADPWPTYDAPGAAHA